jgi:hypothetical protein
VLFCIALVLSLLDLPHTQQPGLFDTILLFWEEAENRWMRAAAVARPVSVVVGIALSAATRSIWWLVGGAALHVGIWPVAIYIARRRGERRDLGGLSGNP